MLSFAFCFLSSDDDDPKRDAAAAPLLDTLTIAKAPAQEDAMVVKSPEAPAKKGTPTRASKHLKKAVAVGSSLEAHQPVASSDDVSIASYSRFFHCLSLSSHAFVWQNLMQKFLSLGSECVEFLKTARASQGMPILFYVFYLFSCFLWSLTLFACPALACRCSDRG
jgi:hypothetical protein